MIRESFKFLHPFSRRPDQATHQIWSVVDVPWMRQTKEKFESPYSHAKLVALTNRH